MGYRPQIDNYIVTGSKLSLIKKLFFKKFKLNVKCIFEIIKGRRVHRVSLENGVNLRLDIYPNEKAPKKEFLYQKLAYEDGVNVAKIIGIFKEKENIWKVCEWIEGVRISEVWNSIDVFEKCGEQVAKLNLVKDPETNQYLGLSDFNKINLIWTPKKEVYIIDFYVFPRLIVDESIVKTLVMGLRTKNRAKAFLNGYKKVRNADKIIKILENNNWTWKTFDFEKETSKDVLL